MSPRRLKLCVLSSVVVVTALLLAVWHIFVPILEPGGVEFEVPVPSLAVKALVEKTLEPIVAGNKPAYIYSATVRKQIRTRAVPELSDCVFYLVVERWRPRGLVGRFMTRRDTGRHGALTHIVAVDTVRRRAWLISPEDTSLGDFLDAQGVVIREAADFDRLLQFFQDVFWFDSTLVRADRVQPDGGLWEVRVGETSVLVIRTDGRGRVFHAKLEYRPRAKHDGNNM